MAEKAIMGEVKEAYWWWAEKNRSPRLEALRTSVWTKAATGGDYREGIKLGSDKAYWWTKVFKETDGEPWVMRRAMAMAALLENQPVWIKDHSLIMGHSCGRPSEMVFHVDGSPQQWWDAYYDKTDLIYGKDREWIAEAMNYWEPMSLHSHYQKLMTAHQMMCVSGLGPMVGSLDGMTSATLQYDFVLEHGYNKIIEMIDKNIENAFHELYETPARPETVPLLPKIEQWRVMKMCAEALLVWAKRHSRLAKIVAENFETDPKRKAELLKMSEIAAKVPANPPEHFQEAIQMEHFVGIPPKLIERQHTGYGFRPDQLWWPYYKRDMLDERTLTKAEALDMIGDWQIRMHEDAFWTFRMGREALAGGVMMVQAVTLGGVDDAGKDACNDLSDVILEAARLTRVSYPTYVFRYHPNSRPQTMRSVFETLKHGLGYPQIQNDTVHTQLLCAHYGVTLEEARSWANVVCLSPNITKGRGGQGVKYTAITLNSAKYLMYAFHQGRDPVFNVQVGPRTGDPATFQTFEELWEAWEKQQDFAVNMCLNLENVWRWVQTEWMQQPLLSCNFERCVSTGIDIVDPRNGEPPNCWNTNLLWAETGDCLYAVKKLIFDERKYTMAQLMDALKADWEGYEDMRQDFVMAPKWGNDIREVDEINVRAINELIESHKKHVEWCGGHYLPLPQAVGGYAAMAPIISALPNGRKQGDPLYDGGCSPGPGFDKKGPTAVLRSCSKMDYRNLKSNLLNQRLSQTQMAGEGGFTLWSHYIKTWHDLGIAHIQLNVVDTETLRAAQMEPERYSELIVRVAGYSAHFVDLTRPLQDSIIGRQVQEV